MLKNGITQVELSEDYYWDIPEEYMYDVAVDPKEMGTVQLTDDWERIQKKMSKKMGPVSLDLIPFAMLLRRNWRNSHLLDRKFGCG